MKRTLITGITGFVGPHLANHLIENGHEVVGLVRASNGRQNDIRDIMPDRTFNEMRFVYGDLLDPCSLKSMFQQYHFDWIFHLAAQSHPPTSFLHPLSTFNTNALGTANLINATINYGRSPVVMNCSTSEVYGAVDEERGPITEDFPISPINPYGVSKAAADMYVHERAVSRNLPFFSTRAFSHTGPRRGHTFSISGDAYQIVRIEKGLQKPVISVGTLSSKRVVMDVRDTVRAYVMLMDHAAPGDTFNVGGDWCGTMGDALDMMLDMTGVKAELKVNPAFVRPIDIPVQIPDSTKLRALTGWQPEIPMRTTLYDLITYWRRKIA